MQRLTFSWALAALVACTQSETPSTAPTQAVSKVTAKQSAQPAPLRVLALTTGNGDPHQPLPWVVALHGLGDRPESFAHLFDGFPSACHLFVLQAPRVYGSGFDWFGERVSGDTKRLASGVRQAAADVVAAIEKLRTNSNLMGKPVVTGFSQGGILSFALATLYPEKIAASLPMGGWLPPSLLPQEQSNRSVPLYVFHGEADLVVPWKPTEALVAQLQIRGHHVTLHSYAGLGHSLNATLRKDWARALSQALTAASQSAPP